MVVRTLSRPTSTGKQDGPKKGSKLNNVKNKNLGRKDSGSKARSSTVPANKAKKTQKSGQQTDPKKPRDGEVWSKSKKKRIRALKAKQARIGQTEPAVPAVAASTTQPAVAKVVSTRNKEHDDDADADDQVGKRTGNISKLQKSFRDRLSGSRFRILNEELYTTQSKDTFQRFQQTPHLFDEYHEGFRQQVSNWPVNPVSMIVQKILRHKTIIQQSELVVADFGCGEADLARQLLQQQQPPPSQNKTKFKAVHSLDLVARGPNAALITACDIANTPLHNGTIDIGVFCLSLMGTNLADFIREAHRVLKDTGVLHIAEVRSRFEEGSNDNNNNNNNDSSSLQHFVKTLDKLGFECSLVDRTNTMFVLMELRKNGKQPNPSLTYTAKPCIYKRR